MPRNFKFSGTQDQPHQIPSSCQVFWKHETHGSLTVACAYERDAVTASSFIALPEEYFDFLAFLFRKNAMYRNSLAACDSGQIRQGRDCRYFRVHNRST